MKIRLTAEMDIRSQVYVKAYPELEKLLENTARRFSKVYENVTINTPIALQVDFMLCKNLFLTQQDLVPENIDYAPIIKQPGAIKAVDLNKIGVLTWILS